MSDKIHTIFDDRIELILRKLGKLDAVNQGKMKCKICNNVLAVEDIGCIYPVQEEIHFCCNELECLSEFIDLLTPLKRYEPKEEVFDE